MLLDCCDKNIRNSWRFKVNDSDGQAAKEVDYGHVSSAQFRSSTPITGLMQRSTLGVYATLIYSSFFFVIKDNFSDLY